MFYSDKPDAQYLGAIGPIIEGYICSPFSTYTVMVRIRRLHVVHLYNIAVAVVIGKVCIVYLWNTAKVEIRRLHVVHLYNIAAVVIGRQTSLSLSLSQSSIDRH